MVRWVVVSGALGSAPSSGFLFPGFDERPAREEIPLEVLHARFDLALGLGAIRPAQGARPTRSDALD